MPLAVDHRGYLSIYHFSVIDLIRLLPSDLIGLIESESAEFSTGSLRRHHPAFCPYFD